MASIVVDRDSPTASRASPAVKTSASQAKPRSASRLARRGTPARRATESLPSSCVTGVALRRPLGHYADGRFIRLENLLHGTTRASSGTREDNDVLSSQITRRTLLAGLPAAALATGAAGCSGSSGREPVRFLLSKPEAIPYFRELIAKFNASQSDVEVIFDTSSNLQAGFLRGNPPDLGLLNYNMEMARFMARGALSDLKDMPEAGRILPAVQELVNHLAAYPGRTSVLPYSVMAASVIYNKQIFADNGVEVPETWDDFLAVCEKLKAAGVAPIYSTFKDAWTVSQGLFDYTVGGMVDVAEFYRQLREEGTNVGPGSKVSFSKDLTEPVSRMAMLASTYTNEDAASRGYGDGNLAFSKGEGAMYFQGPWAFGEIAKSGPDLDLGTFPLPMTDDPRIAQGPGEHRPGRVDPRGLHAQGRRPHVPELPLPAGGHERLQRRPAGLRHDDRRGPGHRPAHPRDEAVLRRGALLPRGLAGHPPDDPHRELPAGHRHRCRRRADAADPRRRLGTPGPAPVTPRTTKDATMATTTASRVAAPPAAPPHGQARKRRSVEPIYYLFLLPALVLFSLAITLPAIMGIFFSFTNSIGFGEWEFVGLINYQAMFSDPAIWQSYLFTFGFAAVTVVVVNVVAFLLAVGLTPRSG